MWGRRLLVVATVVAASLWATPAQASGCDSSALAMDTVYLPNVARTLGGFNGWVTPFIVQNVGTDTTSIEMTFYRFSDGLLMTCRRVDGIKPGTSYADIPNNDIDLSDDAQFSVVVRSLNGPIVAVVNQSQGFGPSTQAAAYPGTRIGAKRVFLPNVTRRFFGYDVPFIVQNVGSSLAGVTANFISFDQKEQLAVSRLVSPGRSTVFDPNVVPGLSDGTQYSVVVNSDQPVAVLANAHNESGAPVAYSHNGLTAGYDRLYASYVAKSGDGTTTRDSPIIIQNVGSDALDVDLRFVPFGAPDVDTGAQVFSIKDIEPLQAKVFDPRFKVGTTQPCYAAVFHTCLGPGEYSLVLTASSMITTDVRIAAVITPADATTAEAYVAQPASAIQFRSFLPNITRTLGGATGWTTPVVIESLNATNAVLRWYRLSDGKNVVTQSRRLVPGTAVWIDPRNVVGLTDDTQYSLQIDGEIGTGQARLTALVYELATGGDSAMVYQGFPSN